MKTLVLDTNVLIDHVHGFAPWLDHLLKSGGFVLVVPTIVVAEYLTAIEVEEAKKEKDAKDYLLSFQVQDLTWDIAEILGRILRRKTYMAGATTGDLIVASTSLYLDAPVVTKNRPHFAKISGLRFFDPKELEI